MPAWRSLLMISHLMTVNKLARVHVDLGTWQSFLEDSIYSFALDTIYDVFDLLSNQVGIFNWHVFENWIFSYSFLH